MNFIDDSEIEKITKKERDYFASDDIMYEIKTINPSNIEPKIHIYYKKYKDLHDFLHTNIPNQYVISVKKKTPTP